jgi:hypothetical protein
VGWNLLYIKGENEKFFQLVEMRKNIFKGIFPFPAFYATKQKRSFYDLSKSSK